MKRILLFLFALTLSIGVNAQATGVTVEVYEEHTGMVGSADLTGYTTYRVYVDLANEEDFLSAIYGLADEQLLITTTTSFYQNLEWGDVLGSEINTLAYSIDAASEFDSWLTIDLENNSQSGGIGLVATNPAVPGEDFENNGGDFFLIDGSIYSTNGNPNGVAGPDLRVLVGQFTTDGVLSGCLNTQVQLLGQSGSSNTSNSNIPFSSDSEAVFGCIDPDAENYDPDATSTDCSCVYPCALEIVDPVITQNACPGGSNAVIDVAASGQQGSVSFELGASTNATGIFSGLEAGDYTITATDGQGCTAESTITVEDPEPLAFDAEVSDISCFGEVDGSIVATTTGGSGEILYSIDDSDNITNTENEYTELSADTYTIYAQDECTTISQEITITEPTELSVTVDNTIDVSCFGEMDGEIEVTATGGTPEYTFSEINNLGPGNYTVTVTDQNSCQATSEEVTITEPAEITLTTEVTPVSCTGDTNGVVTVTAEGGAGNFTYSFNAGEFGDDSEFINIEPGTYEVAALDQDGCSATANIEVTEPEALELDVEEEDVSCNGENDGSFTISTEGGNGGYEYYIDGDGPTTETEFENQEPGTYEIMVEDSEGCSTMTTIEIEEPEELVIANSDVTVDSGAGDGEISIDVDGGTEDYTYDWTGPNGFTSDEEDIDGLEAGEYTVTVTDENGCTVTETFNVLVGIEELFNSVEVSLMPNPSEGEFFLDLAGLDGQEVAYQVVDMQGRVVLDEKIEWNAAEVRELIDLTSQSSGLYYLMIQIGDETGTLKMMKQN
ncbi:T9SS type A sorting domain-containing protein [Halocola ammonii]